MLERAVYMNIELLLDAARSRTRLLSQGVLGIALCIYLSVAASVFVLPTAQVSPYNDFTALVLVGIGSAFALCGIIGNVTDPTRRAPFLFALFSLACAILITLGVLDTRAHLLELLFRVCYWLTPILLWHTLLYRAAEFDHQTITPLIRRVLWLWYGGAAVALTIIGAAYLLNNSTLMYLSTFSLTWFVLGCLFDLVWLAIVQWRTPNVVLRNQFRVMFYGLAIPGIPLLLLNYLPHLFRSPVSLDIPYFFPLGLVTPVAFLYGIRRQRVSHLDLRVSQWILIGLIASSIALAYAQVVVNAAHLSLHAGFDVNLGLIGIGFALTAVTFALLYRRLRRWADRVIYGGSYDYHVVFNHLITTLFGLTDSRALAQTLCHEVAAILQPRGIALLVRQLPTNTSSDFHILASQGIFADISEAQMRHIVQTVTSTTARTLITETTSGSVTLCQPIVARGVWRGSLVLAPKVSGHYYSTTDLHLIEALAHEAGIALENSALITDLEDRINQLQDARQEARVLTQQLAQVQDDEREQLSYRLHDGVLQNLIFLTRQSAFCADALQHQKLPTSQIVYHIEQLQKITEESIHDLRNICRGLYPIAVETVGLAAALRWLAQSTMETHHVLTMLDCDERVADAPFPRTVERSIFTLINEGVTNAVKHAYASTIEIGLRRTPLGFSIWVRDNGSGMAQPPNLGQLAGMGHLGLAGMRVRVERLGGVLRIESAPQQGTTIAFDLPLAVCEAGADSWTGEALPMLEKFALG